MKPPSLSEGRSSTAQGPTSCLQEWPVETKGLKHLNTLSLFSQIYFPNACVGQLWWASCMSLGQALP